MDRLLYLVMPTKLQMIGALNFLIFAVSLVALYYGARYMTDAAVRIAKSVGVSDFIIGATIVSFGTTLPEVSSSVLAMLEGHPGIVAGNVLGSNIANIGLALGISACLYPIYVGREITDIDVPFFLAASILAAVSLADQRVLFYEGLIMIALYLAFVYSQIPHSGRERKPEGSLGPKYLLYLVLGAALLYLGARYLVSSLLEISSILGLSEAVVSFLLLAVGTSLPEISTSVVSVRSGRGEIAVGNILGANAINSLVVLGISSLMGAVAADASFLLIALPAMVLLSILFGFMAFNNRVTRLEGLVLISIYLVTAMNIV
jgi:cation:H+ antiporter